MNIVVTSNKNFLMPLEVCLYSLYKNNENVNVYFINFSVDDADLESIKETTKKFSSCSFTIINLPSNLVNKFKYSEDTSHMIKCLESYNLSIETYGKLLIPYLLPDDLDRCLYLDADIIVNKNIQSFYDIDFDNKYIVGSDACGYTIKPTSDPNEDCKKCFNVGVILFNLIKIREDGLLTLDKVISHIDNSMIEAKACSDELILNQVFDGNIIFEDSYKYNLAVPRLPHGKYNIKKRVRYLGNAYILHYISSDKPWNLGCTLPKESQDIWKDYYNQCFNNR